jgi:signal transduction histidine kinase
MRWLVALQACTGFTMVATAEGMTKYLCGISLTIAAGELPLLVPPAIAWTWAIVQSVLLATIFFQHFGWTGALSGGGAYAGFHLFAVAQGLLKKSERGARDALARTNAELLATRELLAESARTSERVRISRDLHDALGHHLTALSIQLDVAARKTDGAISGHIQEAHAVTRLLLGDVRSVVGQLRRSGRVDLMAVLRPLLAIHDSLSIHLDAPEPLLIDDATIAEMMMRSVQEIITNAVRHAGADNLWITIGSDRGQLTLNARDDGRGAGAIVRGNGLTGISERFAERGGQVQFSSGPGTGFHVRGSIPLTGAAS